MRRFKYHFKKDFPSSLTSAEIAVNQIDWCCDESGAVNLWQVQLLSQLQESLQEIYICATVLTTILVKKCLLYCV